MRRSAPRPHFTPVAPALLAAIVATLLLIPHAPAHGQRPQAPPATERIAQLVERARGGDLERMWRTCGSLEELGEDAVAWAKEALSGDDAVVRLIAAKTLITLGHPERVDRALLELAGDDELRVELRVAAVEMLSGFDGERVARLLESLLDDEARTEPRLRISAARTLFQITLDTQRTRASLLPLIDVDDAAVRAEAAIALGEMGFVDGRVRRLLASLEKEPSELGARARLVLSQDLLMRRIERMRERPPAGASGGATDALALNRRIARLEAELKTKERLLGQTQDELERLRASAGSSGGLVHPLIGDLLQRIERFYVDPERVATQNLITAAAKGMVASLDPFSSFMDAEETREFYEGISGEYAGIGAQVGKDPESDLLMILRPVYQGPAYRAGLVTDDKIVQVEGFETKGVPLEDIVERLKGGPGTTVEMKVLRRGWQRPREFRITREMITLHSVHSTLLPGAIGYVHLSQFGDTAIPEIVDALGQLEGQGMRGLILDLRNNPGGYLDAAVELVDMFVGEEERPIVSQRDLAGRLRVTERHSTAEVRGDYPIVVLVNGASASASEIVSGALQDFGRATLVGSEHTFGKGSVQRLISLPDSTDELLGGDTTLRLTVQYYYLPSGRSIHTQRDRDGRVIEEGGVRPDIRIEPVEIPLWRLAAIQHMSEEGLFEKYVATHREASMELYRRIAEHGDGGDISIYPDVKPLEEKGVAHHAEVDDVRGAIRSKIRRLVEDERGAEFACDYAEDVQLQRAILEMMRKLEVDAESVPEYAPIVSRFTQEAAGVSERH